MNYTIRAATLADAEVVHDIYGAYISNQHITCTVVNPSVEAYREKIANTLPKYPFLVAESEDGHILGYVCASMMRPKDAYKWNVESTIVLAPDAPRRHGIATHLYNCLVEHLKNQGYRYIYVVVLEHNVPSYELHKSLGFVELARFPEAGFKQGEWKTIIWMRKCINDSKEPPLDPPLPFVEGEPVKIIMEDK